MKARSLCCCCSPAVTAQPHPTTRPGQPPRHRALVSNSILRACCNLRCRRSSTVRSHFPNGLPPPTSIQPLPQRVVDPRPPQLRAETVFARRWLAPARPRHTSTPAEPHHPPALRTLSSPTFLHPHIFPRALTTAKPSCAAETTARKTSAPRELSQLNPNTH